MTTQLSKISINQLMEESGVKFGTSGARGLVKDMTDRVCYSYTTAFLKHLEKSLHLKPGSCIGIAFDYRKSSPRIATACSQAIADRGYRTINAGHVPTPAVAHYGLLHEMPTLMITGSHIPDDRNGIKFYRRDGEILKSDEVAIRNEIIDINEAHYNADGMLIQPEGLPAVDESVYGEYIQRYIQFFPKDALRGMKIAVYQHSSVAASAMLDCLQQLGAETIPLAHSEQFIPVDTEAVRSEDITLARQWADEFCYDAIVSTDGDGDRPLIGDENGTWLRGDIVGILCARYLNAEIVVTPISSNTAVEKSDYFKEVLRTRIGSPFVIEAMQQSTSSANNTVVGYEANGGFLTQTVAEISGHRLSALPTRDALLPMLVLLHMCKQSGEKLSSLVASLPERVTYSDRIKEMPIEISQKKLEELLQDNGRAFISELQGYYGEEISNIQNIDTTDGIRVTLENGNIFHLRPSGNAPELRCYTESNTENAAQKLNEACIQVMRGWR